MTASSEADPVIRSIRPTAKFMLSHPAHAIALGLGSGLARKAPGTIGSLWGWASWLVIQNYLSLPAQAALIALGLLLGWWACTVTAQDMGVSDPGAIVWDEVIAIWLIFFLIMPTGFWGQLTAFAMFRFFDIVKPGPVGRADQLFKGFGWRGGWGIIWDDLVAAFCTLMTIALWRWL
ncbi:phosphatidylglycerophosphatase A [Limnohabitans sp. 2KL-17]|uniref:phosphatidylglycerophosphatase A family protein n=1 Tax=Limnohabitans sp. 2KL-17 TaxID=1100704 RepID=UPI000DD1F7F7|nr:phosphatidylglycerophosphatase A [Limnohabitans sp. 2KL-17]PUE58099.1 phosphatidylglycerophosphatase A [Limnohabitans sp. 2KL-17]